MRTNAILLASLLALGLLAGCADPTTDDVTIGGATDLALSRVALRDEGGYTVEQPLDVFLVGLEPGTGTALQAKLTPEKVDHVPFSFARSFPPDPEALPLSGVDYPNPTVPTAVYRVHEMDADFAAAFLGAAQEMAVEGADGILDANAAEEELVKALGSKGFVLDANRPAYVILHGGDALGAHAWRYTYSHGYLEPVRTFGEKLPILVTDVSADPDPYVVGRPGLTSPVFGYEPRGKAYDQPLPAGGDATVAALHELVVDATHHRFLKGPIYPLTTKPCHHITLILAVHTTAVTQYAPGFRAPADWVDVEGLQAAFTNLTGDPVHVELKVLQQPQDDPVLDALARGAGAFATLDALRWYLDENFESFVDPMPECEEYLSLLIFGDAAQQGAFGGIGTYDVQRSHRISFSLVPETSRLMDDSGELSGMAGMSDPSRFQPNWVNLLFSHEVGHTLGQHHPQHLSRNDGPSPEINSFESVWSVMSYQTGDRTHDFGLNDRAQWQRNRLGYAFADAQAAGLAESAEVQAALQHASMNHWDAAYDSVLPLLGMEGHEHGAAQPGYHVVDQHAHPWFEHLG